MSVFKVPGSETEPRLGEETVHVTWTEETESITLLEESLRMIRSFSQDMPGLPAYLSWQGEGKVEGGCLQDLGYGGTGRWCRAWNSELS